MSCTCSSSSNWLLLRRREDLLPRLSLLLKPSRLHPERIYIVDMVREVLVRQLCMRKKSERRS